MEVAGALTDNAAATLCLLLVHLNRCCRPVTVCSKTLETCSRAADVKQWLSQAQRLNLTDVTSRSGILFLQQLLEALTPKETVLLPNYPNPFNPETWIPYQLAKPADVNISIYTANGKLIRTLDLGNQPIGTYQSRSRAAHWDGRNAQGEVCGKWCVFLYIKSRRLFCHAKDVNTEIEAIPNQRRWKIPNRTIVVYLRIFRWILIYRC